MAFIARTKRLMTPLSTQRPTFPGISNWGQSKDKAVDSHSIHPFLVKRIIQFGCLQRWSSDMPKVDDMTTLTLL